VLDAFKGHKDKEGQTTKIANALHRNNFHVVTVPGRCTSMVQPLDVSINRPFKLRLKQLWLEWTLTRVGKEIANDVENVLVSKQRL